MLNRAAACLAAVALSASAALAQDYPTRAVTLIVPYPPGGNTDLMARALQPELSKALGQPVVIVNRGGAAGSIGTTELARARPDGKTILITPVGPMMIQPQLRRNVGYTPENFTPICQVLDSPVIMMTGTYDYLTPPEATENTARQIPGGIYIEMEDIGHFPMSENYPLFAVYLKEALRIIEERT